MAPEEAEASLRRALQAASVDFARPDARAVWAAFKAFAQEPVSGCTQDGALFQCGVYTFIRPEEFRFSFTRQFTLGDPGEIGRLEQLSCTLFCPPLPTLRFSGKASLYAENFARLEDWMFAVEELPEFKHGLAQSYRRLQIEWLGDLDI